MATIRVTLEINLDAHELGEQEDVVSCLMVGAWDQVPGLGVTSLKVVEGPGHKQISYPV